MTESATASEHIDALMSDASAALVERRYFDAERVADEALHHAFRAALFERMGRILLPLQEARRQRAAAALEYAESAGVRLVAEPFAEGILPEPGCVLVIPPLVGLDAKRLRHAGLAARVPLLALAREPLTRSGRVPVVSVGRRVLRTVVAPPVDLHHLDVTWFIRSLEALGDAAIASVQQESSDPPRLVTLLLEQLDALPDHEKLHQALAKACRACAGP